MDDKVRACALYEVYGKMLTEKQQSICELYYFCDLSLGEIAEIKQISRQSVSDAIKVSRQELERMEQNLRFLTIKTQLIDIAKDLDENTSKRITEIIEN